MKAISNAVNKTGGMQQARQRLRDRSAPEPEPTFAKPKVVPHRTFWRSVHKYARMQGRLTPSAKMALKAMETKANLYDTPHLVIISHPEIMNDAAMVIRSCKTACKLLETLKIATPITPKGRLGDKATEYIITRPYPEDEEDERGGYHRYCQNIWDGVFRYYEWDETHQFKAWARFLSFDSGGALEIEHEGDTPTRNFLINLSLKPLTISDRLREPPPITEALKRAIEQRLVRLEELAFQYSTHTVQIKINL